MTVHRHRIPAVAAALLACAGAASAQPAPGFTPLSGETAWRAALDGMPKASASIRTVRFGEIRFALTPVVDGNLEYRTFAPGAASHDPGVFTAACSPGVPNELDDWLKASSGLPTGKRQHKPFVFTKELDKATPLLWKRRITANVAPLSIQRVEDKETGACTQTVVFVVGSLSIEAGNDPSGRHIARPAHNFALTLGGGAPDYGFAVAAGGGEVKVKRSLDVGSFVDPALPVLDDFDAVEPLWLRGYATSDRKDLLAWINGALAGKPTAQAITLEEVDVPDVQRGEVVQRGGREQIKQLGGMRGKASFFDVFIETYLIPEMVIGVAKPGCGDACLEPELLRVQPTRR